VGAMFSSVGTGLGRDSVAMFKDTYQTVDRFLYNKIFAERGFALHSEEEAIEKYRQAQKKVDDYRMKTEEKLQEKLGNMYGSNWSAAGRGIGQAIGQIGSFAIPGIGMATGSTYTASLIASEGKQWYREAYNTTLEKTGDKKLAERNAIIMGAVAGVANAAEMITPLRLFGGLQKTLKGGLTPALIRGTKTAVFESTTESVQELIPSLVAKHLYDEEQRPLDQALTAFLVSLPASILFGGVDVTSAKLQSKQLQQAVKGMVDIQTSYGVPPEEAVRYATETVATISEFDKDNLFENVGKEVLELEQEAGLVNQYEMERLGLDPNYIPNKELLDASKNILRVRENYDRYNAETEQTLTRKDGTVVTLQVIPYSDNQFKAQVIETTKDGTENIQQTEVFPTREKALIDAEQFLKTEDLKITTEKPAFQKMDDTQQSIQKAKAEGQSFDEWVKGQGEIGNAGTTFARSSIFEKFPDVYEKQIVKINPIAKDEYDLVLSPLTNENFKLTNFENAQGFRDKPKIVSDLDGNTFAYLKKPFEKLGKQEQWNLKNVYDRASKSEKPVYITEDGGKTFFTVEPEVMGVGKTRSQLKAEWDSVEPAFQKADSQDELVDAKIAKEEILKYQKRMGVIFPVNIFANLTALDGGKAFGMYYDNQITLNDIVLKITSHHEVAHLAFQNAPFIPMLSKISRGQILAELKVLYPQETSMLELEERLIEMFEVYVKNEINNQPTNLMGEIRKFFEKLLQMVREVLGDTKNMSEIDRFFKILYSGKAKGDVVTLTPTGKYLRYLEATDTIIDTDQPAFQKMKDTQQSIQQAKASGQSFDEWVKGQGGRFHGTSSELKKLATDEEMYSPKNIYGQGFYTTDNIGIAEGYSKKGKGSQQSIYKISEKNKTPVYNIEKPMDDTLLSEINKLPVAEFVPYTKGSTLRQVYDDIRELSASGDFSIDEAQGWFDTLKTKLEQRGFRGIEHTGGKLTGKEPHNVKIYWKPGEDLTFTKGKTRSQLKAEWDSVVPAFQKMKDIPPGEMLAEYNRESAKDADTLELKVKQTKETIEYLQQQIDSHTGDKDSLIQLRKEKQLFASDLREFKRELQIAKGMNMGLVQTYAQRAIDGLRKSTIPPSQIKESMDKI
jgi:hypothetical protein